uniref:Reverse transcriptase zinc-binding domain-containing protein n=1 Tax=Brassica oleracea TaxID=3712 RepID=A0A3P6DGS3_BRAOL|nr:unnamed protein product [Brassica oleracea]
MARTGTWSRLEPTFPIMRLKSDAYFLDERCWLFEKSGNYTTKSGYMLAKLNVSNPKDSFNWKQSVWNVKCSPKTRHFLWKLKTNALANDKSPACWSVISSVPLDYVGVVDES